MKKFLSAILISGFIVFTSTSCVPLGTQIWGCTKFLGKEILKDAVEGALAGGADPNANNNDNTDTYVPIDNNYNDDYYYQFRDNVEDNKVKATVL